MSAEAKEEAKPAAPLKPWEKKKASEDKVAEDKDKEAAGPPKPVAAAVERLLHPRGSARAKPPRDTLHEALASPGLLAALGASPGDWVTVSRQAAPRGATATAWALCLVDVGETADSPKPAPGAVQDAEAERKVLHLPANVIESLGAVPGRTVVNVLRPEKGFAEGPPPAGKAVLQRVSAPSSRRSYGATLRSFFAVPRVLHPGELFFLPVEGVPLPLREVEEGRAAAGRPLASGGAADSSDEEEAGEDADDWGAGLRSGVPFPSASGQHDYGDPLAGLAFTKLMGFRVHNVEAAAGATGTFLASQGFLVDSRNTELVVQDSCSARGHPYIANHFFCVRPAPLPLSLRPTFERLLGVLAPSVRTWLQPRASGQRALAAPPPPPVTVLLAGARGGGKRMLWRAVCERLGLHLLEVNCFRDAQGPQAAEETLPRLISKAAEGSPAVLLLRRCKALNSGSQHQSPAALLLAQRRVELAISRSLAEVAEDVAPGERGRLLVFAGTCEELDDVSGAVRKVFQVEMSLPKADEDARTAAVLQLLPLYDGVLAAKAKAPEAADAKSESAKGKASSEPPKPPEAPARDAQKAGALALSSAISKLTAGLSYADLRSVVSEVAAAGVLAKGFKDPESVAGVVEKAVKRTQGGSKVAVTLSAKVQWDDIGGLGEAKEEVMNCITMPLQQGSMLGGQKLRSGILLFGPPGTGKTLLAKAVATECRVHFLSVKGPELLSMYIGESEKNIRDLFSQARELQPCVLFFDELDSLAPARGRGSDSGGVMDRVVSQLLTEIDSLPATVFFLGATNRPDLLDRSLLRPGRLDRMVYLGITKDKLPLVKACARKFILEEPVSHDLSPKSDPASGKAESELLQRVASECPPNLTGADVAVLCADSYNFSQRERIEVIDDLAAKAHVSPSTLLLFLEALDNWAKIDGRPSEAAEAASNGALEQIFPAEEKESSGSAKAKKDGGLVLYNRPGGAGLVLVNHRGAEAAAVVLLQAGAASDDASIRPSPEPAEPAAPAPKPAPKPAAFAPWASTPAAESPGLVAARRVVAGDCTEVRGFDPYDALRVRVGWRHFQESLRTLQPSVPMADLRKYEQLQAEYQNTKG